MAKMPPATREEIAAALRDVESSDVERVAEIGASLDELGEAIDQIEGKGVEPRQLPTTNKVAQLRELLEELSRRARSR